MNIPSSFFAALGAVLAALVAGFFSFANLVSSKENKVSEFRLAWIDGLRNEISSYTAAVQELVRVMRLKDAFDAESHNVTEDRELRWVSEVREAYKNAVDGLSRIQLRLNPKHIKEQPDCAEAKLMDCIKKGREDFNAGKYEDAFLACDTIREAAAPLLKSTWDLVKDGEPGYRTIRRTAWITIVAGIVLLAVVAASIIFKVVFAHSS